MLIKKLKGTKKNKNYSKTKKDYIQTRKKEILKI